MSGRDPAKTLLLVDGSSYLYRAFHALPELRSPKTGEPTGAIYGVLNMLRKLATDYKPAALACVFDAKGKTFRDAEYSEYKANRTPMPDDLRSQVEPLRERSRRSAGRAGVDGVEADDVIATLADQATSKAGTPLSRPVTRIDATVDDHVLWINTMSNEKLDAAGVTHSSGCRPRRSSNTSRWSATRSTISRCRGGRSRLRIEVDQAIRVARQPDPQRRADHRHARREFAQGARLAAEGAAAPHRETRRSAAREDR
jgi:hypothetical protein